MCGGIPVGFIGSSGVATLQHTLRLNLENRRDCVYTTVENNMWVAGNVRLRKESWYNTEAKPISPIFCSRLGKVGNAISTASAISTEFSEKNGGKVANSARSQGNPETVRPTC